MTHSNTKPATYADIEALPPHVTGEILFGQLHTQPQPAIPHALAAGGLLGEIRDPFQRGRGGPGGWIILAEPEVHLGPHVIVPDLVGWRTDRVMHQLSDKWIDVSPDWVCEILSPSTRAYDKRDKMRIYATYQVSHFWQLDPVLRHLQVFQRQEQNWLLIGEYFEKEAVSAPPFDAISFILGDIWPFPLPETSSET